MARADHVLDFLEDLNLNEEIKIKYVGGNTAQWKEGGTRFGILASFGDFDQQTGEKDLSRIIIYGGSKMLMGKEFPEGFSWSLTKSVPGKKQKDELVELKKLGTILQKYPFFWKAFKSGELGSRSEWKIGGSEKLFNALLDAE